MMVQGSVGLGKTGLGKTGLGRAGKQRKRDQEKRRHKIRSDFSRRHPTIAKAEQAFRKEQKAADCDFGHKLHGTVETLQKASRIRQGAIARMFEAGHLTIDQVTHAVSIRDVFGRIGAEVHLSGASWEARIDQSRSGTGAFFERLSAVRSEVAYGKWRGAIERPAVVLAMICEDAGYTVAARQFGMRAERAKKLLIAALDMWPQFIGEACDEVDEVSLLAAQAGLIWG